MTIDDQVATLFARANPVPSLDLLDPLPSVDIDAFRSESERSSVMTDIQNDRARRRRVADPFPGWQSVPHCPGGGGDSGVGGQHPKRSRLPESVAEAYQNALNAQDIDAVTELVAPERRCHEPRRVARQMGVRAGNGLGLPESWLRGAIQRCQRHSGGMPLSDRWFVDASTRPRAPEGTDVLLIRDGQVQSVTEEVSGDSNVALAWNTFHDWVV